ncbi:MAG: Rep family protein [Culicoidibacterales bacterium]
MSNIKSMRMLEVVGSVEAFGNCSLDDLSFMLNEKDNSSKTKIRFAFINHDKCKDDQGELKNSHYHICLKFDSGRDPYQVLKWFQNLGSSENKLHIGNIERVKGKWGDVLAYLTHENAPQKHQYSIDQVRCNFDFEKEKAESLASKKNKTDERKLEIIEKISSGEIRKYNLTKFISALEYNKYNKAIKDSFEYRASTLKLAKGDRNMRVVFISGSSGSGKTTYAKQLAEKNGYDYFISGSANDPFDNYEGESCVILDDLRNCTFNFVDLLKIIDNNTSSLVKSRFKNKFLECEMLIITSIVSPFSFYQDVYSDEPVNQFYRRLTNIVMIDPEKIRLFYYDNETRSHKFLAENKNEIFKDFEKQKEEIKLEHMKFFA